MLVELISCDTCLDRSIRIRDADPQNASHVHANPAVNSDHPTLDTRARAEWHNGHLVR